MDRLEELVNGMNKNIVKGNLVEVDKYIKSLHDEGYIDKRNATFLLEDIKNNGCTFSVSVFKEDEE